MESKSNENFPYLVNRNSVSNTQGMLGSNLEREYIVKPAFVRVERSVKVIVCGMDHCMLLKYSGEVMTWGSNEKSELSKFLQIMRAFTFTFDY